MSWVAAVKGHPLYRYSDFRNFFVGDILVAIAERYFAITFAWWIISQDGENGKWLGIMMMLDAIPILCLAPFVGPFIDRYNKKSCMLMGVSMQFVFISMIAYLMATQQLSFISLCALSFLMSCFIPQFEDSISASIPRLVDEESLPSATTIQSSTVELSNIFAAVASTSVIAAFGMMTAVYVNMALYAVGVVFLLLIRTDLSPRREPEEEDSSYFDDLKVGFRYIRENSGMQWYIGVYAVGLFFIQPIFILIPMLVKNVIHETVSWVAVFETAFSIGSVVTAGALSFVNRYRNFYRIFALVLGVCSAGFWGLHATVNEYIMAVSIFFIGAMFAMFIALSYTLFQTVVPDHLKGRFFGIVSTIAAGMGPLAYMMVGFLSDTLSTEIVLAISGSGMFLLAMIALWIPRVREEIGCEEA